MFGSARWRIKDMFGSARVFSHRTRLVARVLLCLYTFQCATKGIPGLLTSPLRSCKLEERIQSASEFQVLIHSYMTIDACKT
jgi:hypothetical protein